MEEESPEPVAKRRARTWNVQPGPKGHAQIGSKKRLSIFPPSGQSYAPTGIHADAQQARRRLGDGAYMKMRRMSWAMMTLANMHSGYTVAYETDGSSLSTVVLA